MAVNLTLQQICSVQEIITGNAAQGNALTINWSALNVALALNAGSTPPVSKVSGGAVALSAGAITLDLTALAGMGTGGATVNMNGLKVVAILFVNPATNANAITMVPGASNGYNWNSDTSGKLTLQPGASELIYTAATSPAVSGTVKTLDFSGTGAQAFNIEIVAG